jgi:hypothetical protein
MTGDRGIGWADWEIKAALEQRDAGKTSAQIAAALGRTRAAVCGLFKRVDDELRRSEAAGLLPVLLAVLLALPVQADTVRIMGSSVTLRDTAQPGALAEVEFVNDPSNGAQDDGGHDLAHGGLTVHARFTWNAAGDDDRVDLTPPDGVICLPDCSLTLPEGEVGVVHLYDLNRVGM